MGTRATTERSDTWGGEREEVSQTMQTTEMLGAQVGTKLMAPRLVPWVKEKGLAGSPGLPVLSPMLGQTLRSRDQRKAVINQGTD